jgi:hypothetical protein
MPPHHCPWPVGLADISAMFGVAPDTSTRWKYRSSQGRMDPAFPGALFEAPRSESS